MCEYSTRNGEEADTIPTIEVNDQPSNKYNGWTNYETWNLKLNLDNDYGTYKMMNQFIDDYIRAHHYEGISTMNDSDIYHLADSIKDYLESLFYVEEFNIYKIVDSWDTRSWFDIDFIEIARAYLEEY